MKKLPVGARNRNANETGFDEFGNKIKVLSQVLDQVADLKNQYIKERDAKMMEGLNVDVERLSYEMGGVYYPKLRALMSSTSMSEDNVTLMGNIIFQDMRVSEWVMIKACMER